MQEKIVNINGDFEFKEDSFIYEQCSICGTDLFKTKDIFVRTSSDSYICGECKERYKIRATECMELNY